MNAIIHSVAADGTIEAPVEPMLDLPLESLSDAEGWIIAEELRAVGYDRLMVKVYDDNYQLLGTYEAPR